MKISHEASLRESALPLWFGDGLSEPGARHVSLRLTPEAAATEERDGALLRALEDLSGTPWRWAGLMLAVERVPPFRVAALRGPELGAWRAWRRGDEPRACHLRLQIFAPLDASL